MANPTPTFAGTAGSAAGDSAEVRVEVYRGPVDSGTPVAEVSAARSGAAFGAIAQSNLAVGTYTARAEQGDAAGNAGRSPARTFAVTSSAPVSGYRETVMADAPRAYWRLGEAWEPPRPTRSRPPARAPTWEARRWARPESFPPRRARR